jgi:hypothetical protein
MIAPVRRALPYLLVALALLAGGAWASAADESAPLDKPLQADLDGDGANETVRARETACFTNKGLKKPPCKKGVLRSLFIDVDDTCATGAKTLTLSREMDLVSLAEIVDADRDGQADDLAFEVRAGANSRGVQAKVVRFRADPGGCIAVQKTLFSYPQPATIGHRPKGTSFSSGYLSIHDYDKTPGLELRVSETYARPTEPGCCPSFQRTTFWRYVAAQSGYTPYRTKLRRIPKPF